MSRAVTVARQDFEYAARSYLLWAVVGLFAALVVLVASLPVLISPGSFTAVAVVWLVTVLAGLLVPLIAVVAGYLAVAGERESGTLKILLSLPPTRRDVVLGKFLGRSGVVLASILAAMLVAVLVSLLVYGTVPLWGYALATALTAMLGVSFVGLVVGVSAATSTHQRAMAASVGLYVLFVAFWDLLVQAVQFFLDLGLSVRLGPDLVTFLTVVSPGKTYGRLVDSVLLPDLVGSGAANLVSTTPVTPSGGPFFLQDWFVLLVVVGWTVVPLALGYWRFDRADLG